MALSQVGILAAVLALRDLEQALDYTAANLERSEGQRFGIGGDILEFLVATMHPRKPSRAELWVHRQVTRGSKTAFCPSTEGRGICILGGQGSS